MKNNKISGIYREYDNKGRQIFEIPIKNGNAKGDGWILENGRRIPKSLDNGCISDRIPLTSTPYVNSQKYWQERYLEENKK